ncbi:MAG: hypothetical protein IIB83_09000, partial [Bacteroidetes bacterium]|nr:hypothetical protein [Bacteroidota bacterium]
IGMATADFDQDGNVDIAVSGNTPFMRVEENQVYTIEPRVPVKGYGVSTLEEEVVIRKNGAEFISKPQKKLMLI